jgi:tetratricopeptide (TPR) repeat protein
MSLHSPQKTPPAIAMLMFMISMLLTSVSAGADPAVGTQVVIKPGASLKVGTQVVDTGMSHRIYQVEQVSGDWRWLVSGKTAGWARTSDIIALGEAVDFYTAEIERKPHEARPLFYRGLIYQDHGKPDAALADYTAALRQEPRFVPALINRGNIWLAKRAVDQAITDYTLAIDTDPKAILAHVNRGIAWQTKGDYDKALTDYDEAIRLGLKTAPAYNNRGHAREMRREYDLAIADYDEAIQLDPQYHRAWVNRGNARKARGEYKEALADLAEATRLNPTSPWGYARQAWIKATCPDAMVRDGKEAVSLVSKAAEMEGASAADFEDICAAAYAEDGDFARAIFHEKQAIAAAEKSRAAAAKTDAETFHSRLKLYEEKKPYRDVK